jgi:capping protein beta
MVDQPLKVAHDSQAKRDYLLCDYNRDGDSYRSPWSNEYSPILEDGIKPNDRMRALEVKANDLFSEYFKQYVVYVVQLLAKKQCF